MSEPAIEIGKNVATTLRKFSAGTGMGRPALEHCLFTWDEIVATDRTTLVRFNLPTRNAHRSPVEGSPPKNRWLIHRDVLLHIRRQGDVLRLLMKTGEMSILGTGPAYPIRMPKALKDGEDMDKKFPNVGEVLEKADTNTEYVDVGVNPDLIGKAVAASERGVKLRMPTKVGRWGVSDPIYFECMDDKVDGLVMPMRTAD